VYLTGTAALLLVHSHKKLKAVQQRNYEFGRICLLELNAVKSNQAYWQRKYFNHKINQ